MISKNPKNTHIKAMTRTKHARTEVVLLYKINRILAYFRHYTGNNSILIHFLTCITSMYYNISYCFLVLKKKMFQAFLQVQYISFWYFKPIFCVYFLSLNTLTWMIWAISPFCMKSNDGDTFCISKYFCIFHKRL